MATALLHTAYLLDPGTSRTWCARGLDQPRYTTLPHAHEGTTDQLVHALAVSGEVARAQRAAGGLPPDAVSRRLLLLLEGRWEQAERSWAGALAQDLGRGDLLNATLNGCWLGQARWLLGRGDEAVEAWRGALAACVDGPHVPGELMLRAELGRYLAEHGDLEAAMEQLARCEDIIAVGEDWRGRAGHVALARGAVAAARGDEQGADTAHRQALGTFALHRLPWWRAEALLAWARWLTAAGRAEAAATRRLAALDVYAGIDAPQRWRDRAA